MASKLLCLGRIVLSLLCEDCNCIGLNRQCSEGAKGKGCGGRKVVNRVCKKAVNSRRLFSSRLGRCSVSVCLQFFFSLQNGVLVFEQWQLHVGLCNPRELIESRSCIVLRFMVRGLFFFFCPVLFTG